MMLTPIAANAAKRATVIEREFKPPVGGWNTLDDITDMDPTDAIVLDNLIPRDGAIETRNGSFVHATGLGAAVKTLMTWTGPGAAPIVFGAAGGNIYNVTNAGAVGAAAVSSLNQSAWSHVMFATTGGNYLVACNGADAVRNFDGTTWTTPSITGVSSSALIYVTHHMTRLWFIEKDTLKVWYLAVGAISGAATSIDFGGLCKRGGYLLAMGSWTRDGGAGMTNHAVFVTSEGEVLIYAGTDPSSSTTWALQGIYQIPRPIGRRCLNNVGADLGVLTQVGWLPLSGILPVVESKQMDFGATRKITRAISDVYPSAKDALGWQVIELPNDKLIVINVPVVEGVTQYQYVMNTATGAWCRFTGINAACWGVKAGDAYFGDNSGIVYRYLGDDDNGTEITWTAIQAYQKFGTDRKKTFVGMRPQLFGATGYRPRVGLLLNYDRANTLTFSAPAFEMSGPAWDDSPWDTTPWASDNNAKSWWQGIAGEGTTAAIAVIGATRTRTSYAGGTIAFEAGAGR